MGTIITTPSFAWGCGKGCGGLPHMKLWTRKDKEDFRSMGQAPATSISSVPWRFWKLQLDFSLF
jgi:hypothetical protein